MIFKKIHKHLFSFTYLKNEPVKYIFIGYQNRNVLKKLFKDCLFFDPFELTPFNIKIFYKSMWIFFSNLFTNPKKLNIPISHYTFIFFLLAYIKINKIRKITFLNHYDKIINSILPFLKEVDVYVIEHSLNFNVNRNTRTKFFTNCISLRSEKEDESVIGLGSIKLLYYLEKLNRWNVCTQEYRNFFEKEIIYISTLSGYFWNYAKYYNYNLNFDLSKIEIFLESIDSLKILKDNNDLLKMRFLDNLKLLGVIKKLENLGYKISIIARNLSTENHDLLIKEKKFYEKNFKNIDFYELNEESKYEFLLNNREKVFMTDYSYFGFEALSANIKCIFFSKYLKKYFSNFFKNDSIIFNEDMSNITKKISHLTHMKIDEIKKFKKNLKKNFFIPEAKLETLENFKKNLN